MSLTSVPAEKVDQPRVDRDAGIARPRVALALAHAPRPDHEVGVATDDRLDQPVHLRRIVLAVGVERHDDVDTEALGDEIAGLERGALAAVHRDG